MHFIFSTLKKLNVYIIKQYFGTFIFTFFIAIFILLMNFLWTWVDELIGKGLDFAVLFKLLFYTSVTFVPMALPLAILLSSLICFGNLGEFYELVAMKASGISTWKVMRPLLYFSLTMSVMGFFFSNDVMPVANLRMQSTLYDITHKKMTLEIPEGVFYRGIDKYVIKVAKKSKTDNWMYDVMIYDHSDSKGNVKVTVADSGYMAMTPSQREMIFTLYDGYNYSELFDDKEYRNNRPFQKMSFKRQLVTFDMSQFDMRHMSEDAFKKHQTMLNIKQLNVAIDSLNTAYDSRMEHNDEVLLNRFQHLNADPSSFAKADKKIENKQGDAANDNIITTFTWPLLDNLPEKERQPVISMALTSTANIKESLTVTANSMRRDRVNIKKHEQVLNQKFTLSMACILFFFIGAPLGAIIRKGGLGMPVVVSVVFFVIYYVITIIGERVAVNGDMSVFLGAWISSIVLFPIGIFLTVKATTDAALLDAESWRKFFSKHKKSETI